MMRILAFCCERGPGEAIDLAGEKRMRYPADLTLIQVPCAGRVDVAHLLKAFREGADAVVLVGCLEGNCHHIYGNIEGRKKVDRAKQILDEVGLGGQRLEMFHVASNQPFRIAELAAEMASRVERLGPNPLAVKE
ncbi:MAG: hydrogenase iron-sulfur subunit [Methanomassiliicoccales archaeon]|jgi:coenzyme F420-reducing hydrogenase delta subunit|nr:hydrogenase iron-sulfur subunit [Methanomassiliicoccales archaeon]